MALFLQPIKNHLDKLRMPIRLQMPNFLRHTQNITSLSHCFTHFLLYNRTLFAFIFYNFSVRPQNAPPCHQNQLLPQKNNSPLILNRCPFSPTHKKSLRQTPHAKSFTNAQFPSTRTKYHVPISLFHPLFALQPNSFCLHFLQLLYSSIKCPSMPPESITTPEKQFPTHTQQMSLFLQPIKNHLDKLRIPNRLQMPNFLRHAQNITPLSHFFTNFLL